MCERGCSSNSTGAGKREESNWQVSSNCVVTVCLLGSSRKFSFFVGDLGDGFRVAGNLKMIATN